MEDIEIDPRIKAIKTLVLKDHVKCIVRSNRKLSVVDVMKIEELKIRKNKRK